MPVRIDFPDGLTLKSDERNWTISERKQFRSGKRAGEEYESDIAHYPRLPTAIRALVDLKARRSDAETLGELSEAVSKARESVEKALETEGVRA